MIFRLISYDIPDDRRRGRLAILLENYGTRVQYSVFECLLDDKQLATLRKRMLPLLRLGEDSVRLYSLPKDAVAAIQVLGVGRVTEDAEVFIR